MSKPIAVTMGDPSGLGPELIEKLCARELPAPLAIFGDKRLFGRIPATLVLEEMPAAFEHPITIVDIPCAEPAIAGQPNLKNARAVIRSIEAAVAAVKAGLCGALLTAPINKAQLKDGAEFSYPGHTEFLAALDEKSRVVMMLAAEGVLRVIPATIHIPIREVAQALTPELLQNTIEISHRELSKYLGKPPRIAIAGLNPHAGENGHIGDEEAKWITPLIETLRSSGLELLGPLPADTLFEARMRAEFDVAICMYHDQALIPIKTLAFDRAVNVTLGLSFLRTSPDHGTGYDIAGKDLADPGSFFAAFDLAHQWSQR